MFNRDAFRAIKEELKQCRMVHGIQFIAFRPKAMEQANGFWQVFWLGGLLMAFPFYINEQWLEESEAVNQ